MEAVPNFDNLVIEERDDEHIAHLCSDGFNVDDLGFEGFGNYSELNVEKIRLVVHVYIPDMGTIVSVGIKDTARMLKVFKHFEEKYGNGIKGSIRLYLRNIRLKPTDKVKDVGIVDDDYITLHFPNNDPIARNTRTSSS